MKLHFQNFILKPFFIKVPYQENEELSLRMRMIAALAFERVQDVVQSYDVLKDDIEHFVSSDDGQAHSLSTTSG